MKVLLVVIGLVVAITAYEPIDIDYHNSFGIKEAARIWKAETSADFDGARITGGNSASLGQFPFAAGLLVSLVTGETSLCGASLISNTRLVTAAHCWRTPVSQANSVTVVIGTVRLYFGGFHIRSNDIRLHPQYNQNNLHNDIAIIIIYSVSYGPNLINIQLASGSDQYVGVYARAAGYGATFDAENAPISQGLNYVSLQVITNEVCRRTYGSTVIDSTMCVATPHGRSTCGGDSGGPLFLGGGHVAELIGVISFGHRAGCTLGYAAGFSRVTHYNAWIQSNM